MNINAPMILIVDDVELNRAILSEVFYRQYTVLEAENGRQALALIEEHRDQIAIVLLDIIMPEVDGFEVLAVMNRQEWIKDIPVIMISSENSEDFVLKGYELGVSDFIGRPFSSNIVRRRVDNIIELYRHKNHLENMVLQKTQQLKQANLFMIDTLSTTVEFRNGESGDHIRRIRCITEILLRSIALRHREYDLTPVKIEEISNAAALHDIGKIAVPEQILNKPDKLTAEEFEVMKSHTLKGCEILEQIEHVHDRDYFRYCYDICRFHHERWDGGGYPDGLKGDEIPISAQAVSLADVYDALTSERVYKPAFSHLKAIQMIKNGECGEFNPKLMNCLLEIEDTMEMEIARMTADNGGGENNEMNLAKDILNQPAEDPSERALRLLELEREKYQILAALSDEIIFDYDVESDIATFSEKYSEVFGKNIRIIHVRQAILSTDIIEDKDKRRLLRLLEQVSPQEPFYRIQMRIRTATGEIEWFEVNVRALFSNDMIPKCVSCLGKLSNINKQMIENSRLRDQASRDPLTELWNRNAAKRKITELFEGGNQRNGALLFIDIDYFKEVNDTRGHLFGDLILKYIASEIQKKYRITDIIARVGGDEFIVYLDNIWYNFDIVQKIQTLFQIFRHGYEGPGGPYPLSCSVGIAKYPQDGRDYDELLNKADMAVYQSKKNGRSTYTFYNETMNDNHERPSLSEIDGYL